MSDGADNEKSTDAFAVGTYDWPVFRVPLPASD